MPYQWVKLNIFYNNNQNNHKSKKIYKARVKRVMNAQECPVSK